jgi:drug/metabolite transporter (DMT)-like permease
MKDTRTYGLFAVMCLVWGLTWIAIKTGVAHVPPLFFAGTRFTCAGTLLLGWERLSRGAPAKRQAVLRRADWWPVLSAALLVIVATYSLLFWGMTQVASGLAAVLNLALMPVALFAIGVAYREERFSGRRALAIAIGIAGLAVLFRPGSAGGGTLGGMAAIVAGTIAYSWGSVLSRPLLRRYSPERVSGTTSFVGGVILIFLSLALEPVNLGTIRDFTAPAVAASWLFLVLFGSLVAFTIYLRLVRDWGASRAGMYSFVSPAIAVATGVLISGEALHRTELLGMLLMLAGTWFALNRDAGTTTPSPADGRGR